MKICFDDSLPKFMTVLADALGRETSSSGVILRDSAGRLAFFASNELDQATVDELSKRLRDELGPYARTDRVGGSYGLRRERGAE